jgi:hypothetical protein
MRRRQISESGLTSTRQSVACVSKDAGEAAVLSPLRCSLMNFALDSGNSLALALLHCLFPNAASALVIPDTSHVVRLDKDHSSSDG